MCECEYYFVFLIFPAFKFYSFHFDEERTDCSGILSVFLLSVIAIICLMEMNGWLCIRVIFFYFLFVFMDVKREKLFHSFFSSTSVLNLLLSDLLIFFTSFSQLMIRA